MFDYTGTRYNFTVLERVSSHKKFVFCREGGEGFDVSDATFEVRVVGSDGEEAGGAAVEHAEEVNALRMELPGMEAGSYEYELISESEAGERDVVVAGVLTVKSRAAADKLIEEAAEAAEASLMVAIPDVVGKPLRLKWSGSSLVEAYASVAKEAAEEAESQAEEAKGYRDEAKKAAEDVHSAIEEAVEGVVDEATAEAKGYADAAKQSAQEAAGSAQEAQGAVSEVKGSAQELADAATKDIRDQVTELVEDVRATRQETEATVRRLEIFLAEFDDNVRSVVWVDPETEHLFIGGVDTMVKITGEDGKSPYVDSEGHWRYWDDESQQWLDGGPARGEDGFSPYVNADGYLVYRDPLTGEVRTGTDRMYGVDGRDAESVRRIVVPSAEDIPQEGETCNGGFYYYVPQKDAPPVAIFTPAEERTAEGSFFVNAKSVALPAAGLAAAEAAEALAKSLRAAFPEAVAEFDPETNSAILLGDVAYWQVRGLPTDEWALTQHVRMKRDGYEVYAWLEEPDGSASWVHVGEANDLATAEVYGLTKLGTDATIQGGAPVGTDEHGNMRVPAAETTAQGTVKLSVEGKLSDGVGGIGVDDQGRIWARRANRTTYGVVKPSYTGNLESAPVVGMDDEGRMQIPFATLGQAGVVRLGSMYGQANPVPYRVGVGADETHHLANNLVYGGAIQHMQPSGWAARNMPWLVDIMEEHPEYFVDMYYQGLVTSDQFTQNASEGLVLNSATRTLVGGVLIASSMEDRGDDTVPTAKMIVSWANENYYNKTEVDGKESALRDEIKDGVSEAKNFATSGDSAIRNDVTASLSSMQTTIDSRFSNLNSMIDSKERALSDRISANAAKFGNYKTWSDTVNYLISYATKNYVQSNFVSTERFNTEKKTINDNIAKCVKKTATWEGCVYLTEEEYNALGKIDPLIEYNILGNSR